MNTSEKIILTSISLIALGGLGLAIAIKRRQAKRRKAKNLSIQIV